MGVAHSQATPAEIFDVTAFGANGNDEEEDTAAITAAIAAARENGGGTVYFPAGTYHVSPPGTAVVDLYEKQNGQWILLQNGIKETASLNGWHFGTAALNASGTQSGDYFVNLRNGQVLQKASGTWNLTGKLIEGSGTGWTAGFTEPEPEDGQDGDQYLRYHVIFDHVNAAVFELSPDNNNTTFSGGGRALVSCPLEPGAGEIPWIMKWIRNRSLSSALLSP